MNATAPPAGRLHLAIRGRVQGVGFRFSAHEESRRLGLTGWVRNTADGAVELVAEGPPDRLRRLLAWAHHGPPGALVSEVDERWHAATGEFTDFTVRH